MRAKIGNNKWPSVLRDKTTEAAWSHFKDVLIEAVEECIPKAVTFRGHPRKSSSYATRDTIAQTREK
jgi:hypothetical protein